MSDLHDRKGFRHVWESLDAEVRDEIEGTWRKKIDRALEMWNEP